MLLLFDRVYVKYDFMLDNNVDTLIISPNLSSMVWDELEVVHSNIGNCMHNVDVYGQLFTGFVPPLTEPEEEGQPAPDQLEAIETPYENDLAFFQALLDKGKVNIHVDTVGYDILFSKFLKIFFPSMTREVAWKTYNIFRTNSQILKTTSFVWGTEAGEQAQHDNLAAWVPRTKDEFLAVYDSISRDLPDADYTTFLTSARQKIGMEFMIANRLSGDETYDVFLGEKMYKLMEQRINAEVLFLKASLFNNMFRPWVQTVLGISSVDATNDLLDLKETNDKTRWLFDDDNAYFSNDYQARHPNINFREIRTAIMQAVTQSVTPMEEALTDEMMDYVYDNVAVRNFTTANITTILNSDKTHLGPSVFECDDRIKVNALFLNYIYKLSNDTDSELGSFTI